jgi:lactoylglutathione lyase
VKPRLVGINHVALQVDDLEAAVEFYCDLFQPTSVDRSEHDAAFLEIGDQFLALFERGSREEEPHFGLVVDDKAAARRALEQHGVEILPGHRLDFRDPSGNRVQIVQYDQIQFTKTDRVLRGMELKLGKTEAALDELRAKGLAD